jgi:hypothetical protein
MQEYSSLFEPSPADEVFYGEASTSYLACPYTAAPLIRKMIPNVKIIAVLRHPTDRAVSAYKMCYGQGIERKSFSEIVNNAHNELTINKNGHGVQEYIRNGLYTQLLKPYYEYFDESNIKLLNYNDLHKNPKKFMKSLLRHIGITKKENIDYSRRWNTESDNLGDKQIEVKQSEIKRLDDLYRDEISRLNREFPVDVSDWLKR